MDNEQETKVLLKLWVDEKKNQNQLTLPLGTIIRLTKAEAGAFGCMNNLYQSVENLDEENLFTEHCKTMLLNPRNPYPKYCMKLKVNVEDSDSRKCYQCSACSFKSYFMNVTCQCGGKTNKEQFLKDSVENTCRDKYVFLKGGISFLITDNLQFKCASPSSLVQMLSNVGLSDMNQIREMLVEVGKNEVIHLLARSLISKTPLSDAFLPKQKQKRERLDTITMPESGNLSSISENGTSNNTEKLELRLTLRKSTNKVLCAEEGNEFIDFLFNFLTIPLGSFEDALKGSSGLGSIDNLYKSVEALDPKWFNTYANKNVFGSVENHNLKRILLKPGIAPYHDSENQLLQIGAVETYLFDPMDPVRNSFLRKFGKFAEAPSLFYVMDNLEVRPLSSTSTMRLLQELNVPMYDIEEQVISVG
ncbi:uncharacterized protein LOC107796812 [Nicotiana tabacum]|uniref:Uncharacterized protein LOC107796812 n=2 Tax=Nicotiana TaxID=4085 RepID=A0A1S4AEK5_TOBAC|nr:PREDICTED: uncharacterized protein LOC104212737 [Nicotiana sylvestris]XP_016475120.1 PREDICTED: uncharacterized protein LOC107796812 [Nicotiana tabacum]